MGAVDDAEHAELAALGRQGLEGDAHARHAGDGIEEREPHAVPRGVLGAHAGLERGGGGAGGGRVRRGEAARGKGGRGTEVGDRLGAGAVGGVEVYGDVAGAVLQRAQDRVDGSGGVGDEDDGGGRGVEEGGGGVAVAVEERGEGVAEEGVGEGVSMVLVVLEEAVDGEGVRAEGTWREISMVVFKGIRNASNGAEEERKVSGLGGEEADRGSYIDEEDLPWFILR